MQRDKYSASTLQATAFNASYAADRRRLRQRHLIEVVKAWIAYRLRQFKLSRILSRRLAMIYR